MCKPHAKQMQYPATVRDGSMGELVKGSMTLQHLLKKWGNSTRGARN